MKSIRVLNLYAGIGGNRKYWEGCDVTAVEYDREIATTYKRFFPKDRVAVCDAHEFLLRHYSEFDFIWSSPPCPSHGQYRYYIGVKTKGYDVLYPDMKLYEEIIFLKHYFKGKYIVENVKPYYEPLIVPSVILQRHLLWCNFNIPEKCFKSKKISTKNKISDYNNLGFDIRDTKIQNKRQVLRNCVDSDMGLYIYIR